MLMGQAIYEPLSINNESHLISALKKLTVRSTIFQIVFHGQVKLLKPL